MNKTKHLSIQVAILIILALLFSCVSKTNYNEFENYVLDFKVPETNGIPELEKLPDNIYISALNMKRKNPGKFKLLVCKFLLKYHNYYLNNFHQSYAFIAPKEEKSKAFLQQKNSKYFLLKCLMKYTGHKLKGNIYKIDDDGYYSTMVFLYMERHNLK